MNIRRLSYAARLYGHALVHVASSHIGIFPIWLLLFTGFSTLTEVHCCVSVEKKSLLKQLNIFNILFCKKRDSLLCFKFSLMHFQMSLCLLQNKAHDLLNLE